jgi:hypothetical protein
VIFKTHGARSLFAVVLALAYFLGPSRVGGAPAFPDFYSVKGMKALRISAEKVWAWKSAGTLYGVEAEPDGTLLFAGGPFGVFMLKDEMGVWQEAWNWETLGFRQGDIASAVAAERDPYGRVGLILAAEPGKSRIFLAEARSHQVKIRWEFPCALPPRRARICPDSGNFLVLSGNAAQPGPWRLEEVDFREEKIVWSLASSSGVRQPFDAVRLASGWTVVSDLSTGRVSAFDAASHKKWERTVANTTYGSLAACPLAFEKNKTGSFILAKPSIPGGKAQLFRLDAATGETVAHWATAPMNGMEAPIPASDALSTVVGTARKIP